MINPGEQVAAMLTGVLGRKITHKKMTSEEAHRVWQQFGLTQEYVEYMLKMENDASKGEEQAFFAMGDKEVGRKHLWEYFRDLEVQKQWMKQ